MKPIETLKLANVKQFDITKKPIVNESERVALTVMEKIKKSLKLKK
jgi:hypothetical protein